MTIISGILSKLYESQVLGALVFLHIVLCNVNSAPIPSNIICLGEGERAIDTVFYTLTRALAAISVCRYYTSACSMHTARNSPSSPASRRVSLPITYYLS